MVKKIWLGLLLALHSCMPAMANLSNADKAFIRGQNLLTNPGFEYNKSGWTASGGTFTTTTTAANVGSGSVAGSWDSNSAAQTFTSSAFTIPAGLFGLTGEARCRIQTPSGTATHTIMAFDGSSELGAVTVTSSTTYAVASAKFTIPSSGTIALRIKSVASNEPAINIDDCYLGEFILPSGLAYTDGQLLIGNSSTSGVTKAAITAGSNVTVTNGNGSITIASSASDAGPFVKINLGLSVSSSASAMTFAVKQSDGSTNATGGSPVVVAMRSGTATTGGFNNRSITGALSQTISSGTTLGVFSTSATANSGTANTWVYFYLVDSDGAGTMKLAASTLRYDDSQLQSTVAETFSTSCTQASPSICTSTGHGLNNGDRVQLTGTISGGLTTATNYWVVAKAANTFELAARPNGTAINKTTGGTQTPTVAIAGTRLASDAVYTSVPIRIIAKALFNITAGTWATPSSVSLTDLGNAYQLIGVNFAGNTAGTSSCTSAPCTFVNKTPGIEYIDRTSTGVYTLYFSPDTAPSGLAPDCRGHTHNNSLGGQILHQVYGNNTTSPPSAQIRNFDSGFAAADGGGSVQCALEPNF